MVAAGVMPGEKGVAEKLLPLFWIPSLFWSGRFQLRFLFFFIALLLSPLLLGKEREKDLYFELIPVNVHKHLATHGGDKAFCNRQTQSAAFRCPRFAVSYTHLDVYKRQAQEIAGLLGETTAETKVTLSKLKDMIVYNEENGQ